MAVLLWYGWHSHFRSHRQLSERTSRQLPKAAIGKGLIWEGRVVRQMHPSPSTSVWSTASLQIRLSLVVQSSVVRCVGVVAGIPCRGAQGCRLSSYIPEQTADGTAHGGPGTKVSQGQSSF